MLFKRIGIGLILIFLLVSGPAAAREQGHLIMVLSDSLRLQELADNELSNFQRLLAEGSLGLLNTSTAGKAIPENTYTTIAAGSRALGSSWTGKAFHSEELTEQILNQRGLLSPAELASGLGVKPANPQEIVNVGIYQLQEYNARLKHTVEVGALGNLLRNSGVQTYLLGNADTYFQPKRFAAMLTLDKHGSAGPGEVGREVLTVDGQFPYGLRTDYDKMIDIFRQALGTSQFIVLETGDLSRLEDYKDVMSPAKYQEARVQTLQNIDKLLGEIISTMDPQKDLLILIAPTPQKDEAANNNTLTPLLFYGKDVTPGILTSASTRRPGIVTNTDLAPTIAHFFGLNAPAAFIGRPIYSLPASENLETLLQLNARLVDNYHNRPVILKTYVIMQIIFILSAIALLFFRRQTLITKGFNFLVYYFLVSTYLLTVFRLFQTSIPVLSLAIFLALGLAVTSVIYYLPFNGLQKIVVLALLTSWTILADLCLGQQFIQNSPLGYDPIAGARFYGLGNELAGVLLGSTLLSSTLFFKSHSPLVRLGGIAHLAITALIVFAPQLGADVGGLISSTISFGFLLLSLRHKKTPAKFLILPATALLLLAAVVAFDFIFNKENYSHMALTVSTVKEGGLKEVVNIISRKASMNLKLLNYSIWSKVLLSFLLAFAILLAWPRGFILRLKNQSPLLFHTFVAILIASAVGLVVNDSGIIQAATTFIYLIYPLLHLAWNDGEAEAKPLFK